MSFLACKAESVANIEWVIPSSLTLGRRRHMEATRVQEIIRALKSKGELPCPRCEHTVFDVIAEPEMVLEEGGYFTSPVKLATALVACRRCGYLSSHVLKVLLEPSPKLDSEDAENELASGDHSQSVESSLPQVA